MSSELLTALETIQKEKKIPKEDILHVIENALVSAYKKHVGKNVNVEAKVDPETGAMSAYVIKKIVDNVVSSLTEITPQEAKKLGQAGKVGDDVKIALDTDDFSFIRKSRYYNTVIYLVISRIKHNVPLPVFYYNIRIPINRCAEIWNLRIFLLWCFVFWRIKRFRFLKSKRDDSVDIQRF